MKSIHFHVYFGHFKKCVKKRIIFVAIQLLKISPNDTPRLLMMSCENERDATKSSNFIQDFLGQFFSGRPV